MENVATVLYNVSRQMCFSMWPLFFLSANLDKAKSKVEYI